MNIKQKGQALIITLIILGVGSLVIVPTLNYVNTCLLGIRVAKNSLFTQYALDAAAEYQLWQLDYTDPGDLLGQPDDTIIVNGIEVAVGLDDPPCEVPARIVESGKALEIGLESLPSCISLDYAGTITYTIKFYNCGTAVMNASFAQVTMPRGFQYEGNVNTDFHDDSNPPIPPTIVVETIPDPYDPERQVVQFSISGKATQRQILPGTVGGEAPYKYIKFDAVASVGVGIFTAGAEGITDKGGNAIDDAAPVWSSIYYTKPHAGQSSISLVIKVDEYGNVEVISYQTQ
ncbi:hypothetical protein ES703_109098 [subsurface metagenome]